MADYCENELLIQGDKYSMKIFYDFVGSDIENDFLMEKIMPVPKEVEDLKLTSNFNHYKKHTRIQNPGQENEVKIRTYNTDDTDENEFEKVCDYLLNKHENCNYCDWCNNNWGCAGDMIVDSFMTSDTQMNVTYKTLWQSNIKFIEFLGTKFPELNFEFKFLHLSSEMAGILKIKKGEIELSRLPVTTIILATDNDELDYHFVETEDDAEEFDDYDYLDIIGSDWQKAITDYGFSDWDIENWNELELFFDEKFKNVDVEN